MVAAYFVIRFSSRGEHCHDERRWQNGVRLIFLISSLTPDCTPARVEWMVVLWIVALAVGIFEWRRGRAAAPAVPLPVDTAA